MTDADLIALARKRERDAYQNVRTQRVLLALADRLAALTTPPPQGKPPPVSPAREAQIDGIIGGLADTAALDSALLLPEQVLAVYEAITDLRDLLDHERTRADLCETLLARFTQDSDACRAGEEIGVAKALAVLEEEARTHKMDWDRAGSLDMMAREKWTALLNAIRHVKEQCGPATLPPHEKSLARLRRLESEILRVVSIPAEGPQGHNSVRLQDVQVAMRAVLESPS